MLTARRFQRAVRLFRDFANPASARDAWKATRRRALWRGALWRGDAAASRCWGARERVAAPTPSAEREVVEQALAAAPLALGKEACHQQWRAGARLGHEEALDEALAVCARRLSAERDAQEQSL